MSARLGFYAPLPAAVGPPHRNRPLSSAFQIFNGISPFIKFSHFTAIQETFEREDRVRIIDFDIMQGLQWSGLFHILASCPRACASPALAPPSTPSGTPASASLTSPTASAYPSSSSLRQRRSPTSTLAERLSPFRHSHYDFSGSDYSTLWLLRRLSPKVLTMVEQDLSQAVSFLVRFVETIRYYSLGPVRLPRHQLRRGQPGAACRGAAAAVAGDPQRAGGGWLGEVRFRNWREKLR